MAGSFRRPFLFFRQPGGKLKPLTPKEIESISISTRRGSHIRKSWNYYARDAIAKGVIPGHWPVLGED